LTGSISGVLPVAFISFQDLTSGAGGLAAAIAVGAFIGQALTGLRPATGPEATALHRHRWLGRSAGDERIHLFVCEPVVASIR
jgi:hypothetical protein